MKKRLLEDIAASSNSSLIKIIMAGEEDDLEMRGKIYGCDDYSPPVNWDSVMVMVERRERASKNVPNCPECGTEQVQLVHWQTSNLRYKCRHCKHRFDREENDKA
ncbi:thioredoxin [Escherichia phage FL33]|uniref:Thioredoxin n=1 Tax=Escherichia phage FL33 TaxID=3128059 RepID=A0AAX4R603_9CAUD